jgi:hypothetical protein
MVSRAIHRQIENAKALNEDGFVVINAFELVLKSNDMTDPSERLRGTLLQYNAVKQTVSDVLQKASEGENDITTKIQRALDVESRRKSGTEIRGSTVKDINDATFAYLDTVNLMRLRLGQVGPTKFNKESSRGHLFIIMQTFVPVPD